MPNGEQFRHLDKNLDEQRGHQDEQHRHIDKKLDAINNHLISKSDKVDCRRSSDRINNLEEKHSRLAIKVAGIAVTSIAVIIAAIVAGCIIGG
jgi:hypothetical protein